MFRNNYRRQIDCQNTRRLLCQEKEKTSTKEKTVDGKGATKRALQPTAEPSTAHATEKHIVKQKKSWKSIGKCRRREQRAPVVQSAFPITAMNGCYSGKLIEVTPKTRELIDCWSGLSEKQRDAALLLLKNMNQK